MTHETRKIGINQQEGHRRSKNDYGAAASVTHSGPKGALIAREMEPAGIHGSLKGILQPSST
jgi:hypothetical protein